jgi:hypothetical protein
MKGGFVIVATIFAFILCLGVVRGSGINCDGLCTLLPDSFGGTCASSCDCISQPGAECSTCCDKNQDCQTSCDLVCDAGCDGAPQCLGLCLLFDTYDGKLSTDECLDLCTCLYTDYSTCTGCCGNDQVCLDACAVSCSIFDCQGGPYIAPGLSTYFSTQVTKTTSDSESLSVILSIAMAMIMMMF